MPQNAKANRPTPLSRDPVREYLATLAICAVGALIYFAMMRETPQNRYAIVMLMTITIGPIVATVILIVKLWKKRRAQDAGEQILAAGPHRNTDALRQSNSATATTMNL